jgi:hypothetical protein
VIALGKVISPHDRMIAFLFLEKETPSFLSTPCAQNSLGKRLVRLHLDRKNWTWWHMPDHPSNGEKHKIGDRCSWPVWAKSKMHFWSFHFATQCRSAIPFLEDLSVYSEFLGLSI